VTVKDLHARKAEVRRTPMLGLLLLIEARK
jgi:hypothetical protein